LRVLLTAGVIDGGRSGVGRYVIELASALRANHGEIELFVAGLDSDRDHFPQVDEDHWVTIPPSCGGGLMSFLWHQVALSKYLRRLQIEVLHSPSYRRIVWRSPVDQVATIHDCAPFVLRHKYGLLRGLLGRQVAPRLARRCRQVIAVSGQTAEDLQRYMKLPKGDIATVWNGIDHEHYRPANEHQLNAFLERQRQARPYFLYVARLEHPGKNHVGLIEAYERFRRAQPEATAQLVFGGSDWMGAEAVHARIAASPFRQDIRVLGFVPDEDLPLWYAGCRAVVMPTFFEGFGLPVIEAYACGARAALSDIGALREVGGGLADFFDPRDPDSMAACLQRLALEPAGASLVPRQPVMAGSAMAREDGTVPTSAQALSERAAKSDREARLAWSARFSWEGCARAVAEIYKKTSN
jgi:glycosyltransferase involved in cell wall biosynthesis